MCSCKQEGKPLKEIRYSETGPFGPTDLLVIDFEKPEIVYEISAEEWRFSDDGKDEYGYRKYRYDAEETVKVVERLRTCNFSKCKMAYGDAFSPYEVSWILEIEYMDGKERIISGANKWPKGFDRRFGIKATRQEGETEKELWIEVDEPSRTGEPVSR